MKPKPVAVCLNCGYPKSEHVAANFSDGAFVGGPVLICPPSVYRDLPKKARREP